jgi:hypothetical protein
VQETYGAAEKGFKAFLIDQLAQVMCAPSGGENQHVAELPVSH